jgi:hypothetical protein
MGSAIPGLLVSRLVQSCASKSKTVERTKQKVRRRFEQKVTKETKVRIESERGSVGLG